MKLEIIARFLLSENALEALFNTLTPEQKTRIQSIPELHFQQWAAQQLKSGESLVSIMDAINYYRDKIKDNRFQEILKKHTPTPKNILTIDLDALKTAQAEFDEKANAPSKRSLKKTNRQNYTTTLLDRPDLKIIEVKKTDKTEGASLILSDLARGTKWCVSDTKTGDDYLNHGPLYLIIRNGKKFLCHVRSHQLMDDKDHPAKWNPEFIKELRKYIPGFGIFLNDRDPDYIKDLLRYGSAEGIFHYCLKHKIQWPEAEPRILEDVRATVNYATVILKHRWPEAERTTLRNLNDSDAFIACVYAETFKFRWFELEQLLCQYPTQESVKYAQNVIGKRWLELENVIVNKLDEHHDHKTDGSSPPIDHTIFEYCTIFGRIKEFEKYISMQPDLASPYAQYVIKGPWPEAEPGILQTAVRMHGNAIHYAAGARKSRWPELEELLINNKELNNIPASNYANTVLKKFAPEHFPEFKKRQLTLLGEQTILAACHKGNFNNAIDYAKYVIGGRWAPLEPIILKRCDERRDNCLDVATSYAMATGKRWIEAELRFKGAGHDQYGDEKTHLDIYMNHFRITEDQLGVQ